MRLTVAICTWNRAPLLKQTLARMARMSVPSDLDWQLLVVNNRCTDHTSQVISTFEHSLPVTELKEEEQGLSHARNRAVSSATGDYIVFTDDDVLVDERWLASYVEAFDRHPGASFFGGPILPWFEGDPPSWLSTAMHVTGATYGVRDMGNEPFLMDVNSLPFGANMAYRLDDLPSDAFDTRLGRQGKSRLAGEEVELVKELLDAGKTGWWVPRAVIQHYVPKAHQTRSFIRSFWYGVGYSNEIRQPSTGRWSVAGIPGWVWKDAAVGELSYWANRLIGRPARYVDALRLGSASWGRIAARYRS